MIGPDGGLALMPLTGFLPAPGRAPPALCPGWKRERKKASELRESHVFKKYQNNAKKHVRGSWIPLDGLEETLELLRTRMRVDEIETHLLCGPFSRRAR
jgi:hypothetical protein